LAGVGLLVGVYAIDVFGEVVRSREKHITVDFPSGTTMGGGPSRSLARAIRRYRDSLPDLCKKHGTSVAMFGKLTTRYSIKSLDKRVLVTIVDRNGRSAVDVQTARLKSKLTA